MATRKKQPTPPESSDASLSVDNKDLPQSYGDTSLTLMARDPHNIHAYWDVAPQAERALKRALGPDYADSTYALRLHDQDNPGQPLDIDVGADARSHYVTDAHDNASYRAELGVRSPHGEFHSLAQSNTVSTPRAGVSDRNDVAWMGPAPEPAPAPVAVEPTPSVQPPPHVTAPPLSVESPTVPATAPVVAVEPSPAPGVSTETTTIGDAAPMPAASTPGQIPQPEQPAHPAPICGDAPPEAAHPPVAGEVRHPRHQVDAVIFVKDTAVGAQVAMRPSSVARETVGTLRGHLVEPGRGSAPQPPVMVQWSAPPTTDATRENANWQPLPPLCAPEWVTLPSQTLSSAELHAGASEQLYPGASENSALPPPGGMPLQINTELIVCGRTAPGARVELSGRDIPVREDGTFTMRLALPQGTIPLDFTARSPDNEHTRSARTSVTRHGTSGD
jgi:hypothetical protein